MGKREIKESGNLKSICLTLPLKLGIDIYHAQLGRQSSKLKSRESFGQNICSLLQRRNVFWTDSSCVNLFLDVMLINPGMLGTIMMYEILSHGDCRLAI